ncbi:hypothetical protein LCGC14_2067850 [marine sediment metagenome]|uniref:Uncharacterized protein n=1 Tax=marine sediment metagenome TaxID=412755 RepID=A0A0F9EJE3_9ZZZZ
MQMPHICHTRKHRDVTDLIVAQAQIGQIRQGRDRRDVADLIFSIPKCIAQEIQYHFKTLGDAIYAP